MHCFRLWAPGAEKVRVQVEGRKYPLQPAEDGWWEAAVEAAAAGSDYAYFLDDDELALPDPRSEWQPQGVHGPSRILDHRSFVWHDDGWSAPPLASGIVYELHIGTFTPEGTFDAARGKLDGLKELGVTHVELLPVNSFPGERGWGYDGVDLFAPQESYGGPEGLKRFVEACHARGLAVLMDVVYNHFGPSGNYVGRFGPYFTDQHKTPWGDAVNLEDRGSHQVRRFFLDNAAMWLRDYHCDGLRLDAVHAYMDRSAIHFMEQLAQEVHTLEGHTGRHYVVIAESDLNDPRLVIARDCGGYGMDAQWSDDFHHALISVLSPGEGGYYGDFGKMADLAKALRRVFVYDGKYSQYRDRVHGRPVTGLPGWRFLGFSQNHDQVGNRAKGERLVHETSWGRAKIAAAVVLAAPFVPMLFQGEEWAASTPFQYFTDHEEELGRLVSEGRRKEFAAFGWDPAAVPDPQAPESFECSKLNWAEREEGRHGEMLDWYRRLIQIRREVPELTNGDLSEVQVRFSEEERWMAMERGRSTVAFSLAEKPVTLPVLRGSRMRLASSAGVKLEGESLTLVRDSAAVLLAEHGTQNTDRWA